jgi:hypothetical protein
VQPPAPGVPPQPGHPPHHPPAQFEPGYGWQTSAGYGPGADPGYWPSAGPGYGGPTGYGQGGYGRQPGYGPAAYGPGGYRPPDTGPNSRQIAMWVTLGVVIFLGLLSAILTLTLLMDISSAVSRVSDMCNQYGQLSGICKQSLRNHGVRVPGAAVTYLLLIILGSVTALGGALLMMLRKHFGQFLILGGGLVMLLFTIVCAAHYGGTGRITYDLIAGVFIAIAGGLLLLPQIRQLLGLPPALGIGRRPSPFGGIHQPYGRPYPGPYGQPGPGGYPPRW